MTIAVGDKIPDVTLRRLVDGQVQTVQSTDVLGQGRVVLFAVPGAFTPGCSKIHLPGYVENIEALRAKNVDVIACVSVNDAWVMDAWGKAHGVGADILMLADGGEFTTAMGLDYDASAAGMGAVRSQRYAAVLDNGVVTDLQVEPKPGVDLSSCESMLARL